MSRQEVYRDIEGTLGLVPGFIQGLPDEALGPYWEAMKRYQLSETLIPLKYKQLIGLAVSAAIHCPYCTFFHTEAAKLMGATGAELEETANLARETSGWSTYLHGIRFDLERFKDEFRRAIEYIKTKTLGKAE